MRARLCDLLTYKGQPDDGLDAGHGGRVRMGGFEVFVYRGDVVHRCPVGLVLGPAKM